MPRRTFKFITFCRLVLSLLVLICSISARSDWQTVGDATSVAESTANGVVLQTSSGARVLIEFFDLNTVRVRLAPNGKFEKNISYAIENKDRKTPIVKIVQTTGEIVLTNYYGSKAVIRKSPLIITIFDESGEKILEDASAAKFDKESSAVEATKMRRSPLETYYGFGEKALPFSRDGQVLSNWNTDAYRYTAGTDPLYQSIPFFIALNAGKAYGLFFLNESTVLRLNCVTDFCRIFTRFFDCRKKADSPFCARSGLNIRTTRKLI